MEACSPFDSFRPHFDSLARIGYFKFVLKDVSYRKRVLHDFYRGCMCLFVVTYNLQHVIQVVQSRHSTDQVVSTLFIFLTTINTLGKHIAFNMRSRRVDNLINIIKGPDFAPTEQIHEKVIRGNAIEMSRLLMLFQVSAVSCSGLWAIFPIVNKVLGQDVRFSGYFPFKTDTLPMFVIAHVYLSGLTICQAYAHFTMDCTIIAFYNQVTAQIKVLRYNLEHLVSDNQINTGAEITSTSNRVNRSDIRISNFSRRLAKCMEHYRLIVWYCKEVEQIFWEALFLQFCAMAWVICMTVYKIVGLSIFSVEFVSISAYLICMLAQLFVYCYYGTQVKAESELINQSAYNADWLSLSPVLRRHLLIFMECCFRPVTPTIGKIIPMSLETNITVLKSSYTLFTFLDRR